MQKIFSVALLGIMLSASVYGKWAVVSFDELVAESDLIVIGTLHSATEDDDGIGRGRIRVEEVIAGKPQTLEGRTLSVGDNLRIRWADNWACAMGMHQRRIGKRGVWLLDVLENGAVSAAYPGNFTELDELAEIRRLLRKSKAKRSTGVDIAADHTPEAELTIRASEYVEVHLVNISPHPDYSLARALLTLLVAIALYGFLYRNRFRIRLPWQT